MVSPSTRLAVRRRAMGTANWLDKWAAQLWVEMNAQNVAMYTWGKDGKTGDSPFIMTLKRNEASSSRLAT